MASRQERESDVSETVNILLVDDRPENLLALETILTRPDYHLLTARSGDEALRISLREKIAVVLLDVVMPGMDGYEVARHLKQLERTRNIPIIFLTAIATDLREIYRAYEVGAVDYMTKPLEVEVVRRKVAVFVDLVRQREEIERQGRRLLENERREHELRIAELRLASDRRYRKLVSGIDHVIAWSADATGKLTFVSRQAPSLMGFPVEEFLRPNFWERHLHRDDRGSVLEVFERALAEDRDFAIDHRLIAGDGSVRWFHTGVSSERDREGAGELHGISIEVTAIKRSEELQALLADAGSILTASLDYRLTMPSLAKRLVPVVADFCFIDEIVGQSTLREMGAAHADAEQEVWIRNLERGQVRDRNAPFGIPNVLRTLQPELHADASDVPWLADALLASKLEPLYELRPRSCMFVPLWARDRILGILTCVTQGPRQLGEADLALAELVARRAAVAMDNALLFEESQRTTRAREELLAIVSHDLRSPLGSIVASASMLEQCVEVDCGTTQMDKLAKVIHRSAGRMERLIDDLLDFAVIRAGQVVLDRKPADAKRLIAESVELFEPIAAEKGVRLHSEVPKRIRLDCDAHRVLQVLSNLIGNAIRYTDPSGSVVVRADRIGNEARISVSDTGPGMSAEELARMWDFFWRAKNAPGAGVGLGLWIAKGLVEAHGGRIWAESKPGVGTTFFFTLHLAQTKGAKADGRRHDHPS